MQTALSCLACSFWAGFQTHSIINDCRYSTAIVLCDQSWIDPDLDDTNGIQVREQRDMLRLESQILLVQLHIRKSLTVSTAPHGHFAQQKHCSALPTH